MARLNNHHNADKVFTNNSGTPNFTLAVFCALTSVPTKAPAPA